MKVPVTEIKCFKVGEYHKYGVFVKNRDMPEFSSFSRQDAQYLDNAWRSGYLEALHDMADLGLPIFR